MKKLILPTTRYQGSKRKIADWIYSSVKKVKFNTVLDVFGGTGVISYLFKKMNKNITYNDYLDFNYKIGLSIIENKSVRFSRHDVENLFINSNQIESPGFIDAVFKGIYYPTKENIWLDSIVTNLYSFNSYDEEILKYKKAIAFNALFQSCLCKRPFNLFHRKNLNLRRKRVGRSFGNKITWEKPFDELFKNLLRKLMI